MAWCGSTCPRARIFVNSPKELVAIADEINNRLRKILIVEFKFFYCSELLANSQQHAMLIY
jgi:hypothetical protein